MKQKSDTNDHRLKALFGEALGANPTTEQTEQAWQEFITSRRASSSKRRNLYIAITSAAAIIIGFGQIKVGTLVGPGAPTG